MATVIEEALIRIAPDFSRFKPELVAGLKEASEGVTAKVRVEVDPTGLKARIKTALTDATRDLTTGKVKIDVDPAGLRGRIKAAVAEASKGLTATVKVNADADVRQAKVKLDSIKDKTVTVKAKVESAGGGGDIGRTLFGGIVAASADVQKRLNDGLALVKQRAAQEAAEQRKKDADAASSAKQAAQEQKRAADQAARDVTSAAKQAAQEQKKAAQQAARDTEQAAKQGAKAQKQQMDDAAAAAKKQGRAIAESLNVLPGIGGVGPQAARIIAGGIVGGAPLIGQAITAAFAGGVGVAGIATGIAIAAKDPRVIQSGRALALSLGSTLGGAARPFTDSLLRVMPTIGTDLAGLKPQLAQLFAPIATTLPNIEHGLVGLLSAALPGMQTAAQNAAQYIDAIASKGPDIGRAFGQFIADVTNPASINFLKRLIDFADQLVVTAGKVVKAFADVSATPVFRGLASAVNAAAHEVNTLVTGLSALGGPAAVASIVVIGAAIVLFGHKMRAAWDEARIAARQYNAEVAKGGLGISKPAAWGKALFGGAAPAAAAAEGEAAAGSVAASGAGKAGLLRRLGGGLLSAGLIVGGGYAADALTSAGHPVLASAASGALTGAGIGMFAGPEGALVGAGIGAGVGALVGNAGAKWQQHNQQLEQAKTDLQGVADQYARTGSVMAAVQQIMAGNDVLLKNLATHGAQFGASLPKVLQAAATGDTGTLQQMLKSAQADKAKADKNSGFMDTLGGLASGKVSLWGVITGKTTPEVAQAQQRSKHDQQTIDALTQALGIAKTARSQNQTNIAPVPDIANMFANFQTTMQPTQQMQVINSVIDTYNNWKMAIRGVQDAQYEQAQTAQSTAQANAEALHGIATAEHQVAQAHFATTQAQLALTQARKDAIQNLKDLSRQVRDLGDNEEDLKIRLVQAQLTELQTRGLSADSLVRRQAVVGLDEAKNALADFRSDEPTTRANYALAKQRGVEGAPGVVSAKNALGESQYNEAESMLALKIAHQNYDNTVEASRRANELAARAVTDANTALGQQNVLMGLLEKSTGLTTTQIQYLHDHLDSLTQKPFLLTLTDGNSAATVGQKLQGVYGDMAQLAQQFGITLPNWTSKFDSTIIPGPAPKGADTFGGGSTPGPVAMPGYAGGGPVDGWSPHDRADNILARVTADEFVVNARSSRKHRALLEAVNSDRYYADGGLVLPFDRSADRWLTPVRANINSLRGVAATGGDGASAGGQSIGAVQNWLKSTVDPLDYVFGATGPGAYDCSGLVGEVWARLTGNPDYRRYFVTGTERGFLKAHGWQDGPGTFTVGFNGGHTMGNLAGLNFEAANPRSGIHVGAGTSNVLSFPNVMHLPQLGDKFLSVSSPINVPDPNRVTVGGLYGQILKTILAEARRAAFGGVAGGDPGLSGGGNVEQWRATVVQALRDNGMSTSDEFVSAVLRQIQTESSGNANAIQQVHDINWPNNRARGLMQTTPTTFGRYAFPDHTNIFNGYDNLLAALNYVKHRYHGDVPGVLGHGHGYDSGGWLRDVGFNLTGQPEAVLTPTESRAYVKHAEAISGGGEMRLDDWTINRLAQALSTRPIPVHVDGRKVADAVIPHLERRF